MVSIKKPKNVLVKAKKGSPKTKENVISGSLKKRQSNKNNNKKLKKPASKKKKKVNRGIVYIKHLPHGFEEEQLRGYFSQFGEVTRLRLARSPRTLNSKGYAFLEFRYPEVAQIAAETMNNYLMFKTLIKTRFIPPETVKFDYFRDAVKKIKVDGKTILTSNTILARNALVATNHRPLTSEDKAKYTNKVKSNIRKNIDRLEKLGIDFDTKLVTANLGKEINDLGPKKMTINDVPEEDDENDETFNVDQLDIDTDDSFEDYEYDSEHTEDDEDDNININIEAEKIKLDSAISIAKQRQETLNKTNKVTVNGKGKGKKQKLVEQVSTDEPVSKKIKGNKGKKKNTVNDVKDTKTVVSPVKEAIKKVNVAPKATKPLEKTEVLVPGSKNLTKVKGNKKGEKNETKKSIEDALSSSNQTKSLVKGKKLGKSKNVVGNQEIKIQKEALIDGVKKSSDLTKGKQLDRTQKHAKNIEKKVMKKTSEKIVEKPEIATVAVPKKQVKKKKNQLESKVEKVSTKSPEQLKLTKKPLKGSPGKKAVKKITTEQESSKVKSIVKTGTAIKKRNVNKTVIEPNVLKMAAKSILDNKSKDIKGEAQVKKMKVGSLKIKKGAAKKK